jgi:hypothetical protein
MPIFIRWVEHRYYFFMKRGNQEALRGRRGLTALLCRPGTERSRYRLTQGVRGFLPMPLHSPTIRQSTFGGFMVVFAARSRDFRFLLLLAIALFFLLRPSAGWAYSDEEQQACTGDAFRLCGEEIPDVSRVQACMVRKQSQLSPGCRVYFRPEPSAGSARPLSIRAHAQKRRKHRRPVE